MTEMHKLSQAQHINIPKKLKFENYETHNTNINISMLISFVTLTFTQFQYIVPNDSIAIKK